MSAAAQARYSPAEIAERLGSFPPTQEQAEVIAADLKARGAGDVLTAESDLADTLAFAARVFQYARMGHAEDLATLFGQGLPANLRNDKGDSLLMLAAYNGQAEATRVILEAGGDPELANDRGQTPLGAACFKGGEEIVRLLLEHGARIEGHGGDGRTPLMIASAPIRRIAVTVAASDSIARSARTDVMAG